MMEEMTPPVAVTLGLVNPVCENPVISNPMEIMQLKLVTETASLLSDPSLILDVGNSTAENDEIGSTKMEIKDNCHVIENLPDGEEDEIMSLGEESSLRSSVELLPLDPASDLSVPVDIDSESSLPIAVEIEGTEDGQILAKVISLEERDIKRRVSDEIQCTSSEGSRECESGPRIKESLVPLQLSGENDPSKGAVKSIFELDCVPLWGSVSIIGHRPEMEDAVLAEPRFMKIPIKMFISDHAICQSLSHLTSHFFGVYDGHGGLQVANYCRERIHLVLEEELKNVKDEQVNGITSDTRQMQWEKVFNSCFLKVDDEVSGKVSRTISEGDSAAFSYTSEPVAPETVGSTAVVAVISSSHIIVANSGDSRAVIYRGKEAIALSVDHKPNREDEYARIEASGGKVIQWNGHRVFGVLAMSRSIGDRYLNPWIIPDPEVMFVPRTRADECLILASDGLWDVITNEEACEAARKRILIWHKKNGTNPPLVNRGEGVDPAAQAAAEYLANLALQKGSKDNISIIVVDLKAQRKFKNKS